MTAETHWAPGDVVVDTAHEVTLYVTVSAISESVACNTDWRVGSPIAGRVWIAAASACKISSERRFG